MNDYEDILKDAVSGIKTKRTRKRISRFNPEDGLLFDVEEGKAYVEGKGIIHVRELQEKILDCGHSAANGIGHIAECGHSVCALCVERFVLECAKQDCFKKLCTVPRCRCCAREVEGVFYCRKHFFWVNIGSFASFLILGSANNEKRAIAVFNEYYSRRLQLRRRDEAERE
jgi:hypothetical protein